MWSTYISHLCHRHKHASHILSFSSVLFFCKLIIPCLFCAVCPDGKASCSHNAVVIPPAHGALAPVNTLPIVSWTSFISPALVVPPCPRPAELDRLRTVQVSLPQPLFTGQGKPCVVVIWWCAVCRNMGRDLKAVLRVTHWRETLERCWLWIRREQSSCHWDMNMITGENQWISENKEPSSHCFYHVSPFLTAFHLLSPLKNFSSCCLSDSHTGRYSCKLDGKEKKNNFEPRKYFVSKYFWTNDARHVIGIFTMAQRHGCVGLIKNVKGLAACRSLPALGSSPVRQPAV